jgi:hypothetical protein
MKKFCLVLALVSFVFALPMYANADIIGNVTLAEQFSSPTGVVTFNGVDANVYLNYSVSLNGGGYQQAFCVENQTGPGVQNPLPIYTLISVDAGLGAFLAGGDPARYLAAAWVANFWSTGGASKAAAQIAIWELIYDYGNINLSTGNFESGTGNAYTSAAAAILALVPYGNLPSSSSWALAVNPEVAAGGQISEAPWQNYLVRVPEPLTLILFGFGLISLACFRRKE